MNDKKWSNYQIDIFNAIKNSNKNIIVNAVAGSGKTTGFCAEKPFLRTS